MFLTQSFNKSVLIVNLFLTVISYVLTDFGKVATIFSVGDDERNVIKRDYIIIIIIIIIK